MLTSHNVSTKCIDKPTRKKTDILQTYKDPVSLSSRQAVGCSVPCKDYPLQCIRETKRYLFVRKKSTPTA